MTATLEALPLPLQPSLRSLTLAELAGAWDAGQVTWEQAAAECDRRDRADRAAARARSARAVREQAWYEAAYAQYLAAEAEARGNLLSPLALAEGISEPMVLWRGAEAWAMARASEELRAFWDRCPRLTLAEWKRQAAAERRAECELADQAAELGAELQAPAELVAIAAELGPAAPQPTVRLVTPSRPRIVAERPTVRRVTIPAAPIIPPMRPGAIARYAAGLTALADHTDKLTAAILARRDQLRRAS